MAIVFSAKIRGSGPEMQFSQSNYYTGASRPFFSVFPVSPAFADPSVPRFFV
jgi:hypothetical protein